MKLLIINGPNLNLLGTREPDKYGNTCFDDYFKILKNKYKSIEIDYYQSNHEGDIIDKIQDSKNYDGIILNAGAYTHTSVAIHDAILAVNAQVIEVHLTQLARREEFRQKSFISSVAIGTLCGFGLFGYDMAIEYFKNSYQN